MSLRRPHPSFQIAFDWEGKEYRPWIYTETFDRFILTYIIKSKLSGEHRFRQHNNYYAGNIKEWFHILGSELPRAYVEAIGVAIEKRLAELKLSV